MKKTNEIQSTVINLIMKISVWFTKAERYNGFTLLIRDNNNSERLKNDRHEQQKEDLASKLGFNGLSEFYYYCLKLKRSFENRTSEKKANVICLIFNRIAVLKKKFKNNYKIIWILYNFTLLLY
ncbi:MAG: hypothetical protein GY849_02725 [Deltaproteobacteria bacterium]|nr:hypothetical protein [Deltaproteobacteria bacterium]